MADNATRSQVLGPDGRPAFIVHDAAADRAWLRAEEGMARVVETVGLQLAQDILSREDAGWRKLSTSVGAGDFSDGDRRNLRSRCLALWTIDPTIGNAGFLLNSGTFGNGTPKPKAVDKRVQKLIDRFWDDEENRLAVFDREALRLINVLLMVDGEEFITLHTSSADSRVKLASIDPDEIVGVIPHPQNKRRPILYKRTYKPQQWNFTTGQWDMGAEQRTEYYADWRVAEYVDPMLRDEADPEDFDQDIADLVAGAPNLQPVFIYHLKTNTVGQRGVPEIYRAYDWVKAHSAALSDLATMTAALAAFAWRKKIITKSATVLQNAAAQFNTPPPGAAGVAVENQNSTLSPIDVGTGQTSNQTATVRQMLLQGIRSWGFGEHWYSDASTGNLATAAAMELPAIWRIQDRQEFFGRFMRDLTLFAVNRAIAMQDPKPIPKSVDTYFDLDFPPPRPMQPGEIGMLLGALTAASGSLIDPQEAAYQAYVALGTTDIQQVMERQFPPQEKLEGEAATGADPVPGEVVLGADGLPVDQAPPGAVATSVPPAKPPVPAQAKEAVPPFSATRDGRSITQRFAAELQARVITPWWRNVRSWLREQGAEPPPKGQLTKLLQRHAAPNKAILAQVLGKYHLEAANAGGQRAVDKVLAKAREAFHVQEAAVADQFTFNLRDPALKAELAKQGTKITGEVTDTMLQDLRDSLATKFYEEGWGPGAVADDLEDVFPETYANRAETIARTETLFAQAKTQDETYQRNGVESKQWLAILDEKTRPEHEAMHGTTVGIDEPFVFPDGSELMFPGDENSDNPSLLVNCFIDGQTPIFTNDGNRDIVDIKVGDLVLTHAGRFRPVTAIHRNPGYAGEVVKIHFAAHAPGNNGRHLTMTPNHPVQISTGEWVAAGDLKPGQKLMLMGLPCVECGKPAGVYSTNAYCSRSCGSRHSAKGQWANEAHRESMSRQTTAQLQRDYANGLRDPMTIAVKARQASVEKYGPGGALAHLTQEHRGKAEATVIAKYGSRAQMIRERVWPALGRNHLGWTAIEKHMGQFLTRCGRVFQPQFTVGKRRVDFYVPGEKLFVECDGSYWHQDVEADRLRDIEILRQYPDHAIAHVTYGQGDKGHPVWEYRTLETLNHEGQYAAFPVAVENVDRWTLKRPRTRYNLSVAEDESYVAKGVCCHNCRCDFLAIFGEGFSAEDLAQPWLGGEEE